MEDNADVIRVAAFCDGRALRNGLARAYGDGYADIDPAALVRRLAAQRGWEVERVRVYAMPGGSAESADAAWLDKLAAGDAQVVRMTGNPSVRITVDAMGLLRTQAAEVILVLGGTDDLVPLAEEVRAAARRQGRNVRFASAFAPSPGKHGRAVPTADLSVTIDRETAEKSLMLASGPVRTRRIHAGRAPTAVTPPAPAPKRRPRPLRAVYGVGVAATVMALVWEDVVATGLDAAMEWDRWRWAVSVMLATAKALVWPFYWLARAFGIEAG